jgi:GNAT superfamily N-acetyltransferase
LRSSSETSRVIIRPFEASDSLPDLTALLHRAYAPLAEIGLRFVATYQDEEVTRRRIARGECYVAEKGGRVVGTILFQDQAQTSGCPYYDRPDVSSIHQFAVEPGHQKVGIGAALMARAESRAAECGAAVIALDTAEPARHLIAYYERRGYRIVDITQWKVTNYRSVVMSRTVGGADGGRPA